ncbi:hypothetical protein CsSME_00042618 [Camellia sinensis var. sinensis]
MLNASLLSKNVNLSQTLIALLDKCKSISHLKQIHALVIAFGLTQDDPFASRILSFAASFDSCLLSLDFSTSPQSNNLRLEYNHKGLLKNQKPNQIDINFRRNVANWDLTGLSHIPISC